jgi:hypothetical protein
MGKRQVFMFLADVDQEHLSHVCKIASPDNLVLLQQRFKTLNTIKPEQHQLLWHGVN